MVCCGDCLTRQGGVALYQLCSEGEKRSEEACKTHCGFGGGVAHLTLVEAPFVCISPLDRPFDTHICSKKKGEYIMHNKKPYLIYTNILYLVLEYVYIVHVCMFVACLPFFV